MASIKCILLLVVLAFAMVASLPMPEPFFFGPKHEHYIIHVPYHVHTVHHHSYHKVPVYVSKDHHGWD